MSKRTFVIRAGVRRNYGKHEIYYELSEQVEVESTGDLRGAFIGLQSLLDGQVAVYEQVSLPHVQLPNAGGSHEAVISSGDAFPLETLKVEFADNRRRVRACGGKFVKHGVAVYEECGTDLPIETLSFGVHDFRHLNLTVKVDMEDGKPKRAVSIR